MRRAATNTGIAVLLSRIAGLVRERFFAAYLGTSDSADAFRGAFRMATILQDMGGDRVVSSAFIPEYSRALADEEGKAKRVALAAGAIHSLALTVLVAGGVLLAPTLVAVVNPGFGPEKAELAVRILRILFATTGLLAIGSWCLGVLNSHRRFFLPFAVPILSALAITIALIWSGRGSDQPAIAEAAAWGALVGAALQVLFQLPMTIKLARARRSDADELRASLARVGKNALPGVGRGLALRLSAWVEVAIASAISTGALAALGYAQILYALPGSLFAISITAAVLPEMSADAGDEAAAKDALARRLDAAIRHTAFLMVPSAVAFIALGDVIAAAVYQSGEFTRDDALYVWSILAASSIGLLGLTIATIFSTTFFALGDTVTPLRAALIRISVRTVLGLILAIPVIDFLGLPPRWGAAGLGAAIGISGWVEFILLRRRLDQHLGNVPRHAGYLSKLWLVALGAAGLAWGARWLGAGVENPIVTAVLVLGVYGLAYAGATMALGVPEAKSFWRQLNTRIGGSDVP